MSRFHVVSYFTCLKKWRQVTVLHFTESKAIPVSYNIWRILYEKYDFVYMDIEFQSVCVDLYSLEIQCIPDILRSIFFPITHFRQPYLARNRREVWLFSWVPSLTEVLPSNSLHCVQYRTILHHDISRVYSQGRWMHTWVNPTNVHTRCRTILMVSPHPM